MSKACSGRIAFFLPLEHRAGREQSEIRQERPADARTGEPCGEGDAAGFSTKATPPRAQDWAGCLGEPRNFQSQEEGLLGSGVQVRN